MKIKNGKGFWSFLLLLPLYQKEESSTDSWGRNTEFNFFFFFFFKAVFAFFTNWEAAIVIGYMLLSRCNGIVDPFNGIVDP